MNDRDPIQAITDAIEAFGDHNRIGAVGLAKELRAAVQKVQDAMQRTAADYEERIELLKSKARRQNDLAWNEAIRRVELVIEDELITEDAARIKKALVALRRVPRAVKGPPE